MNLGVRMGASVNRRWRVSDLECELQTSGTWRVAIRQHGQVVRSATVESASAAHQSAIEIALLERSQRRP